MAPDLVSILYEDPQVVVVAKPPGLIVHASPLAGDDDDNLVARLRVQLDRPVWTVHRLDRATSGVMVFALDVETASRLGRAFEAHQVRKTYLAVVRGWPAETGEIDHPVKDRDRPKRPPRPGLTRYRRLATVELPVAIERYPQSRFGLLALEPLTGRRHQLRRHMKHISHPIIGDTSFGRGAYNRWFRSELGVERLLLHAWQLSFEHPLSGVPMAFACPPENGFAEVLARFGWSLPELTD